MEIIKVMSEQMQEELEDAEHYSRMALEWKDECPEAADLFSKLSHDEVEHSDRLHDLAVRKIRQLRSEGRNPTQEMQGVYDYLHERYIKMAEKVADLQRLYNH